MLSAQYRNTQCSHKMFFPILSSALFFVFVFPFSKHKSFLPLLFLKFQGSSDCTFPLTETCHQCERRLEKKILHLETKNLLLRTIHFTDDIYLLKVNDENIRTISDICSKLIKTPE